MFLDQFFTLSPILTELRPNSAKNGSKSTKNDFHLKSSFLGRSSELALGSLASRSVHLILESGGPKCTMVQEKGGTPSPG